MVEGVPARFAMPASEISMSRLYNGFDSSSALHANAQMSAAVETCPTNENCLAVINFARKKVSTPFSDHSGSLLRAAMAW